MARSLTPDSLELILNSVMKHANENSNLLIKQLNDHMTNAINQMNVNMSKMLETFSTTVQVMVSQVTKTISETLNEMTKAIMSRFEALEQTMPTRPPSMDLTVIKNAMWDVEKERLEKAKRSKNVIISGLPSQPSVNDDRLVQSFIEQNLTVKPAIANVRRFGKEPTNTKLCVTFMNPEAVADVISSSRVLRMSTDPSIRKVFMNRDLTPKEAEAAYQKRCEKRLKAAQDTSSEKLSSVLVQPNIQPFRK